jgi:hypothetical protein
LASAGTTIARVDVVAARRCGTDDGDDAIRRC